MEPKSSKTFSDDDLSAIDVICRKTIKRFLQTLSPERLKQIILSSNYTTDTPLPENLRLENLVAEHYEKQRHKANLIKEPKLAGPKPVIQGGHVTAAKNIGRHSKRNNVGLIKEPKFSALKPVVQGVNVDSDADTAPDSPTYYLVDKLMYYEVDEDDPNVDWYVVKWAPQDNGDPWPPGEEMTWELADGIGKVFITEFKNCTEREKSARFDEYWAAADEQDARKKEEEKARNATGRKAEAAASSSERKSGPKTGKRAKSPTALESSKKLKVQKRNQKAAEFKLLFDDDDLFDSDSSTKRTKVAKRQLPELFSDSSSATDDDDFVSSSTPNASHVAKSTSSARKASSQSVSRKTIATAMLNICQSASRKATATAKLSHVTKPTSSARKASNQSSSSKTTAKAKSNICKSASNKSTATSKLSHVTKPISSARKASSQSASSKTTIVIRQKGKKGFRHVTSNHSSQSASHYAKQLEVSGNSMDQNERFGAAVKSGNIDAMRHELESGTGVIDVNQPDKYRVSLLAYCALMQLKQPDDRFNRIAELLIAYGADVNATSTAGFAPLMIACKAGVVGFTQALLKCAKIRLETTLPTNDDTALMLAVRKGHVTIVEMLLAAGANITCENRSAETCFTIAAKAKSQPLLELLTDFRDCGQRAFMDAISSVCRGQLLLERCVTPVQCYSLRGTDGLFSMRFQYGKTLLFPLPLTRNTDKPIPAEARLFLFAGVAEIDRDAQDKLEIKNCRLDLKESDWPHPIEKIVLNSRHVLQPLTVDKSHSICLLDSLKTCVGDWNKLELHVKKDLQELTKNSVLMVQAWACTRAATADDN